jgi:Zn-dependent protease with chaperone function
VSDPAPPRWQTFLLSTHPPALERIARAEAARD